MKRIRGRSSVREQNMNRHGQFCFVSRVRQISSRGVDLKDNYIMRFLMNSDHKLSTGIQRKDAGLMPAGCNVTVMS
jgi:hypothetical protein